MLDPHAAAATATALTSALLIRFPHASARDAPLVAPASLSGEAALERNRRGRDAARQTRWTEPGAQPHLFTRAPFRHTSPQGRGHGSQDDRQDRREEGDRAGEEGRLDETCPEAG